MTWSKKGMLHFSRSLSLAWAYLWYFHRFSWPLSKVIAEKLLVTFHDMKWPWRHDEGSLVAIFRLKVSSLPVTRCLRVFLMVFLQKRRLSFFSHWLIVERLALRAFDSSFNALSLQCPQIWPKAMVQLREQKLLKQLFCTKKISNNSWLTTDYRTAMLH